jgi:hypothetical protein
VTEYYDTRAPECDDWWKQRGSYDLGDKSAASWFVLVHA